jgi:DsbC/DsbD-like thiol-disulfide interchange protein
MKHLILPALALCIVHPDTAFTTPFARGDSTAVIAVRVDVPQEAALPGSEVPALFILTIRDGWHINAPFPSDENLVGTSIHIAKSPEIDSVTLGYPDAVERQFDFSDIPLLVYEETITVPVRLRLVTGLHPGTYAIPAVITYQACNSMVCLAPATLRVEIPLRVESRHTQKPRINRTPSTSPEKGQRP